MTTADGSGSAEHHLVATHDPPPKGIPNPVHDDDGAASAGYSGALVAGVRTYGWAAEAIIEALGDRWLTGGWVDFSLGRPLFTDDQVTITVAPSATGDDTWDLTCTAVTGAAEPRVVLQGTCGRGQAPFAADLDPPGPAAGGAPPAVRAVYDLDSVPIGSPLVPLSVPVSHGAAARLATEDLGIDHPRYTGDEPRVIHPYFLAARMSPLTRHNFTYGPTIHVRSQIQHCGDARSGQELTINAKIVDAYDRNGHWYQVLDGTVYGDGDAAFAVLRHHTIFRPRGTTPPPPITEG